MRHTLAALVLMSPLALTAAAFASQPLSDTAASTARPLSTGVKSAKVLYTPNIDLTPAALDSMSSSSAEVVLQLTVDEKGAPQNVAVIKSPSGYLNEPVAAAVRHYRFAPAMLDNQAVASPLTLTVVVQH